jgi:hypothetical protein
MLTTAGISGSPLLVAAVAFGLLGTVLVIAGVFALLGLHPLRFALRMFLGLVLLSLGGLAGLIGLGVQGYRSLTREEVAAHLFVRPTSPQHLEATVRFADGREKIFPIAGDEIYVDAHILKWKPIVNALGLHTAYELGRIAGRYRDIGQERSAARTVYALGQERDVDLFDLRQRYQILEPLLDADYGSATFVPVTRPTELEVRVSTTGLLMRDASHNR